MPNQEKGSQLVIGLFGFGVVGEALYQVLSVTPTLNATIKKVCIKHAEKERIAAKELFTTDENELLNDPEINVIIELINDSDAAFHIVNSALSNKKAVVSANKKMIAEHFETLLKLQKKFSVPFLYEAAVCASIPVIRNLEEYYDNDLLQSISGIVNGSTNYILTKVFEDKIDFETALIQAQIEGFAESNPTLDVEGTDAVNKLSILLAHAYGIIANPAHLVSSGIQCLVEQDAVYAKEKGYEIKLIGQAKKLKNDKVAAFVLPQFVKSDNQLFHVKNEYNGMVIESSLADKQFFYGKGAGGFPTASAVLSDLSALRYDYRYEYKKLNRSRATMLSTDFYIRVYVSFEELFKVPQEEFERILSWSSSDDRCHVIGIIHFSKLLEGSWWRKAGTSLILLPDSVIENYYANTNGREMQTLSAW